MEVSHFTDALSVCFFALLGIWASVVRRHWFLRFATVGGFLLITLLLPAYELVVEFGLQMAVIATGVWLARGRRDWRPRLSLETALLLMVVVAVVFAIVARIPEFNLAMWLGLIGIGVVTGCVALVCLWMVFGQARLWIRISGGAVAIALMLVILHFGNGVQYTLNSPNRNGWLATFIQYYDVDYIYFWLVWNLKTTAIALTAMLSTLMLARYSGWFDTRTSDRHIPPSRREVAARIGVCTVFLAVAAPLAYIFYRLLTPPPLPAPELPVPNGYEDILAAGRAAPLEFQAVDFSILASRPFANLQRDFELAAPIAQQIEAAVKKPCRIIDPFTPAYGQARSQEMAALKKVYNALMLRVRYAQQFGSHRDFVDASLLFLQYGHAVNRGSADINDSSVSVFDYSAADSLRTMMGQLTSDECRAAAATFLEVDAAREPLADVVARQRIVEKHRSWDGHLRALLHEWAGRDPIDDYRNAIQEEPYYIAQLRVTGVDLALQAYCLDHNRPPDALEELTPTYLPSIPLDNCSGKPLTYRRRGDRYTLYSFGTDGDDDHGMRPTWRSQVAEGDLVTTGPHGPPRWMQLRSAAVDQMKKLWQIHVAVDPTAK